MGAIDAVDIVPKKQSTFEQEHHVHITIMI